jgi:uncharacterized protein YndB with AHSA1/START domain
MVTVRATIYSSVKKVWELWTTAEHVKNWNFASENWCCPEAENHLLVGGEFHYLMSAKDGSVSFDFWGTYQNIELEKQIDILLGDGRKMKVTFEDFEDIVIVTEVFEPEKVNPIEMQQSGWQMILDNFKKYTETQS